ncbi:hypothetical protein DMENIID0001_016450 [Sergentomyia squamirostris]
MDELIDVPDSITTENELDSAVELTTEAIKVAAKDSTPPAITRNPTDLCQHVGVQEKLQEKRRLRRIWQSTRHPVDKRNFNRSAKELTKLLECIRDESISHYLENLSPTDSTDYSLWRATKRIVRPQNPVLPPIKKPDGAVISVRI